MTIKAKEEKIQQVINHYKRNMITTEEMLQKVHEIIGYTNKSGRIMEKFFTLK